MEKIKNIINKLWKELSIFGLVIVLFFGLLAYHKIVYVTFETINDKQVNQMIKDKKSFNLVIGSDKDNTTLVYKQTMDTWIKKHRFSKLYYLDVTQIKDYEKYLSQTLKTDTVNLPQTLKFKDGKLIKQKNGNQTYYRLDEFMK